VAVLLFCSAHGAPGVTTTALACALTWPADVLLADCDRDPSQAVLAGYLQGTDAGGRGLAALAQAHRDGLDLVGEVRTQSVPLGDDSTTRRWFLPGFTHASSVAWFAPVWPGLAEAMAERARLGCDVIVDGGRIGRDGLPGPLVARADRVAVVVRSSLPDLAALRLALPDLRSALADGGGFAQLGLVVVGPGRPYTEREIAAQFRLPVWGVLPWAPKDAALLADGAGTQTARLADRPLLRAARALASSMFAAAASEADRVGQAGVAGTGPSPNPEDPASASPIWRRAQVRDGRLAGAGVPRRPGEPGQRWGRRLLRPGLITSEEGGPRAGDAPERTGAGRV